jgi:threonine dehydrogenase-like Zn-dependent dehydrogenase
MAEWAADGVGGPQNRVDFSPRQSNVLCDNARPLTPRAFGPRRGGVVVVTGRCCPASTPGGDHDEAHHPQIGQLSIKLTDTQLANTAIDWNQVIFKGLEIKGIYGREMFESWYKMVAMLQSGLDLSPIITHRFPVDQYQTAFAAMLSGSSGKIILDWTA